MIENYLAQDALRMAVDLHGQKYRDERPTDEKVLGTAEAFYQWMRKKHEEHEDLNGALKSPNAGQEEQR